MDLVVGATGMLGREIALFAVAARETPRADNAVIRRGGPEALSGLYAARGDVIDMAAPLRLFPVPPLPSVYEHLQSSLLQAGHAVRAAPGGRSHRLELRT